MNGFSTELLSRVEDVGINASAPPQQRWIDGWLVRTSPGKAKRARCVNALAAGRLPLEEKLALATEVYAAADLPLVVRITPFTQPGELDAMLGTLGMQAFDDTRVMVADLALLPAPPALPGGCRLEPTTHAEYAEIVGALRGSPAGQRKAHAERLASSPVPYRGWALRHDGEVLACGQLAAESSLVGIYDVYTAEASRNRGLASVLCARLLADAAAAGARIGYLQVDAENAPARAVYARLGFRDGYAYHYRSADPAS